MTPHRIAAELSGKRLFRLAEVAFCTLLLMAFMTGGTACQATGRQCPLRSLWPAQRVLSGTVVGLDGQPVSGVLVTAYDARQEYLFAESTLHSAGSDTTGPDGTFRFRVPQSADEVCLIARKVGSGMGWTIWRKSPPGGPAVVSLGAPGAIAGQVVGPDRKPVAGATVSIAVGIRYQYYLDLGSRVADLRTRTDDQGRFCLNGLSAGQSVHLEVTAPGLGQLDTICTQDDGYSVGQTRIDLEMPPAATIEASVIAKGTGKPATGAELILFSRSMASEVVGTPVPGKPGHFRWTGIAPGLATVFLATPRHAASPKWAGTRKTTEITPDEPAKMELEVLPGQITDVRLSDSQTGEPIEGIVVGLFSPALQSGSVGRTDGRGVARLRLAPGEYQNTWAEGPGYREYHGQKPVTIQAGKSAPIDVTMVKLPCYRGTVIDADGKPLLGAEVTILGEPERCISDEKGGFALYPPLYDTSDTPGVTVIARYPSANQVAAVDGVTPDKAPAIHLAAGRTQEVTVTDADGRPIANATVTALLGHCNARPRGGMFTLRTDASGRCTLRALPKDRPMTLCVQASGHVAQARLLPPSVETGDQVLTDCVRLESVQRLATGPVVREVAVPSTPHEEAIWGATGRDSRGHVWFAVSKKNQPGASADLFELIPDSGQIIARGNVVDELKRANLLRDDEQQMKIHSKIYEVDGYLYFASMDEKGEDEQKLIQPLFGSHLWRLCLADNTWEHLLTIPEAIIGIAVGGGKVYGIGYWDHALYQYDIATKASRHIKVGACFGHISRNIIADANGHVYLPRCRRTAGMLHAELVEFDGDLREIGSSLLPMYYDWNANWSYGITALQSLPDGSIAMLTHNGWLTIIRPQDGGPARIEHLGWFHPDGAVMADTLFLDKTGRYLMGAAQNSSDLSDWVTYDIQTGRRTISPFSDRQPDNPSWGGYCLYGSLTQDDLGNCYIVGQARARDGQGSRPILLQANPKAHIQHIADTATR